MSRHDLTLSTPIPNQKLSLFAINSKDIFHCLKFVFKTALLLFWGADLAVVAQAHDPRLASNHRAAAELSTPSIESVEAVSAEPAIVPKRHSQFKEYRFALAANVSTLGVGVDSGLRLAHRANIRAGFNAFSYNGTFAIDNGLKYAAALKLRSVQAFVDFFPFGNRFHMSPGLLLYNGNHVGATIFVPPGQKFTSGSTVALSSPENPISGRASTALNKIAPAVLFGFGNLLKGSNHFAMSFDTGVVFQGAPSATLSIGGTGCDSNGIHCSAVTQDHDIEKEIRSEQLKMNNVLSIMKYYPVVSVEFGYKF